MESSEKKRPKGVFLLPNMLTTAALFAGFYSIISGINGEYVPAVVAGPVVETTGAGDAFNGGFAAALARVVGSSPTFGETPLPDV